MSGAAWRAACETSSAAATQELAARIGARLGLGDVIALEGDLGSGKTTFTRGLCRGAGVRDLGQVSSPTYVLEHIYDGPVPIFHYDAYRLSSAEELLALGFEDRLRAAEGVLVVEWADRVAEALPETSLHIEMLFAAGQVSVGEVADDELSGRLLSVTGQPIPWRERLRGFF